MLVERLWNTPSLIKRRFDKNEENIKIGWMIRAGCPDSRHHLLRYKLQLPPNFLGRRAQLGKPFPRPLLPQIVQNR